MVRTASGMSTAATSAGMCCVVIRLVLSMLLFSRSSPRHVMATSNSTITPNPTASLWPIFMSLNHLISLYSPGKPSGKAHYPPKSETCLIGPDIDCAWADDKQSGYRSIQVDYLAKGPRTGVRGSGTQSFVPSIQPCPALVGLSQLLPDRIDVGRLGVLADVAGEGVDGLCPVARLKIDQSEVAHLVRLSGLHDHHLLDDLGGALEVLATQENVLEVVEHPVDKQAGRHGIQVRVVKVDRRAIGPFDLRLAFVFRQHPAAVEGIDVDVPLRADVLHDEMQRQTDADDRLPQAARNGQVDDRKRDRNACLALEDLVQEAVARIVVVLDIADESLFV